MGAGRKMRRILAAAVAVSGLMTGLAAAAEAGEAFSADYQVKFLLDPGKVLDGNGEPVSALLERWQMGSDTERAAVMYLETPDRGLQKEGWLIRVRKQDDKKKLELTFKKRYRIQDGNADPVLGKALDDGFDPSDETFSAEYDWGLSSMTLTFEHTETVKWTGKGDIQLPETDRAVEMALEAMPEKMRNWKQEGWGTRTARDAVAAGPVVYTRYSGTYCGAEINLEVWPVPDPQTGETSWITELWFKLDSYEQALALREALRQELESGGILLQDSTLKTESVIRAFLGE